MLRALAHTGNPDLASRLRDLSHEVRDLVPSCVALSLTVPQDDLTFTFTLTVPADVEAAIAARYTDAHVARPPHEHALTADPLSEAHWQRSALTDAAPYIRSTLSLPLLDDGHVTGELTLYAADPLAFTDHRHALRALAGARTDQAAHNTDLSFRSRDDARRAPHALADHDLIERTIGHLMARYGLTADAARTHLHDTATRTGHTITDAARHILDGP
ncbi:GAF and ANTAR domain-containing protein [Cellulomonas cellasea]|uniref:GAF domain-containing protein n=1 Tax=Cellulomonas cellasea TaxID=43670 RepID=A0A7W4YCY9_9CELL|nr:GAF and ANTAR domain-containing protein [Cellulomonas cellasea]MBB2925510.1 GAF domain-containing protein [Cellulomonas cellasea]